MGHNGCGDDGDDRGDGGSGGGGEPMVRFSSGIAFRFLAKRVGALHTDHNICLFLCSR